MRLWVLAAFVLATGGVLHGTGRVTETWHRCLSPLPRSRWYLLPVPAVTAAVLTGLYVTGMGTPAPTRPGTPPEAACRSLSGFPVTG